MVPSPWQNQVKPVPCSWQTTIDTGQLPGLNRAEQDELGAANKRIRELETEVAILKRARELLREPDDPKGCTRS